MGIAIFALNKLLEESCRQPFEGALLELGVQDIHFTCDDLQRASDEYGVKLTDFSNDLSQKIEFQEKKYISNKSLYQALGFSSSTSVDNSAFEGADVTFDMNMNELPERLIGAFDVILDSGTIEHIFHIPNVLRNIVRALKPNGRIIHFTPSSNHTDHGFYMFSPTLFWDYYTANEFTIESMQWFRYTPQHDSEPWKFTDYRPGCLAAISYGGLDNGMYGVFCVVTKTDRSTFDRIPRQGAYTLKWQSEHERILIETKTNCAVDRWKRENANIIIYGAGEHTKMLLNTTRLGSAKIIGIVDKDVTKHGSHLNGFLVEAPETTTPG